MSGNKSNSDSILGTVASLGSDLINGLFNKQSARDNMRLQGEINLNNAKTMADYNQDIWSKQFAAENARQDELNANQYSTLVQSLKSAGLNPAFAMGQQTGNLAVNSPSGGSGSVGGVGLGQSSMQLDGAGAMRLGAEIQNINAQTAKTRAEEDEIRTRTGDTHELTQAEISNELQKINNLIAEEDKTRQDINESLQREKTSQQQEEVFRKTASKIDADTALVWAEENLKNTEAYAILQKLPLELQEIAAKVGLAKAQTYKSLEEAKLATMQQTQVIFASLDLLMSAGVKYKETCRITQEIANMKLQGQLTNEQIHSQKFWNNFYDKISPYLPDDGFDLSIDLLGLFLMKSPNAGKAMTITKQAFTKLPGVTKQMAQKAFSKAKNIRIKDINFKHLNAKLPKKGASKTTETYFSSKKGYGPKFSPKK